MRFKNKIRHNVKRIYGKYYYLCNQAVGRLCKEQIINKTAYNDKKVTCKNCKKASLSSSEGMKT
jgi:hypothetical protein